MLSLIVSVPPVREKPVVDATARTDGRFTAVQLSVTELVPLVDVPWVVVASTTVLNVVWLPDVPLLSTDVIE